jgi:ABC-type amino acid transport system permease subunit
LVFKQYKVSCHSLYISLKNNLTVAVVVVVVVVVVSAIFARVDVMDAEAVSIEEIDECVLINFVDIFWVSTGETETGDSVLKEFDLPGGAEVLCEFESKLICTVVGSD